MYVADQRNKRIQVFDNAGTFKSQIANVGVPTALCISGGPHQYLFSSHTGDPYGMDDAAIYKLELDGRVVGRFGKAGKLPKELGLVNAIDCRKRERGLRRRADELAGAEADPGPNHVALTAVHAVRHAASYVAQAFRPAGQKPENWL